jgi:DNA-binding NtrC family response regulator
MTRLLLVDDEPNVVASLQRLLKRRLPRSVRVDIESDPLQAVRRVREVAYAVVVSDFRMPGIDGIELLKHVRDAQPHAVRMMLTASSEFTTMMDAVNEVEVFRYLPKPWNDDELVAQVNLALDRAEASRHERELADAMRVQVGEADLMEVEMRRLEELEPGITRVDWGPNGEVLIPLDVHDDQARAGAAPSMRST